MTTSEEPLVFVGDDNRGAEPRLSDRDWWGLGEGGTQLHMGRGPSTARRLISAESQAAPNPSPTPKPKRGVEIHLGPIALLVSATCLIVGSLSPWATLSSFGLTLTSTGTDAKLTSTNDFVSGWITLIAGIALVLLAGLMLIARQPIWRSIATLLALCTVGYSIYALIDVYQTIHQNHRVPGLAPILHSLGSPVIGFGLIMVVVASGVAAVASLAHSRTV